MFHIIAVRIVKYGARKDWTGYMDEKMLVYALERRLISLFFYCVVFIFAVSFNRLPELTSFILPFSYLRSKVGGWHASSVFMCLFLSTSMVLLILLLIGPFLSAHRDITFLIAFVTNFSIIITSPTYPTTLDYDNEIKHANNIKKNRFIVVLCILQLVSLIHYNGIFATYSILATGVTEATILIEKQKRKDTNDETKEIFYSENHGKHLS